MSAAQLKKALKATTTAAKPKTAKVNTAKPKTASVSQAVMAEKKQAGMSDRAYRAKLKGIFDTEEKQRRQMIIDFLTGKKEKEYKNDVLYDESNPQLEIDTRRFLEDRPLFIQVFEFLTKNKFLDTYIHRKKNAAKESDDEDEDLFGDSDSETEEKESVSEPSKKSKSLASEFGKRVLKDSTLSATGRVNFLYDRLDAPYLLLDLLEFINGDQEIKTMYEKTHGPVEEVAMALYKKWLEIEDSFLTIYQKQFKNISSSSTEMSPGHVVRRVTSPSDLDPEKVDVHAISLKEFAKQRSFQSKLVYKPYEHAKNLPVYRGIAERSFAYPWIQNYDSTYVRLVHTSPSKNADHLMDKNTNVVLVDPNPPHVPAEYFKATRDFHILALHNGVNRHQDNNVFKVTESNGNTYHFEIIHRLKNNKNITQDEDMAKEQDKWFDKQKGNAPVSQVQPKRSFPNIITQSLTEYGIV